MFRYADSKDKLLMFFGVLGSIGDGLQYPLTMYVLSHVINEYGSSSASVSIDTVNKVSILKSSKLSCSSNPFYLSFLL